MWLINIFFIELNEYKRNIFCIFLVLFKFCFFSVIFFNEKEDKKFYFWIITIESVNLLIL